MCLNFHPSLRTMVALPRFRNRHKETRTWPWSQSAKQAPLTIISSVAIAYISRSTRPKAPQLSRTSRVKSPFLLQEALPKRYQDPKNRADQPVPKIPLTLMCMPLTKTSSMTLDTTPTSSTTRTTATMKMTTKSRRHARLEAIRQVARKPEEEAPATSTKKTWTVRTVKIGMIKRVTCLLWEEIRVSPSTSMPASASSSSRSRTTLAAPRPFSSQ